MPRFRQRAPSIRSDQHGATVRIAHALNTLDDGGAVRSTLRLAEQLAARRAASGVLIAGEDAGGMSSDRGALRLRVLGSRPTLSRGPMLLHRLIRILRDERPDVVMAGHPAIGMLAVFASLIIKMRDGSDIPVVIVQRLSVKETLEGQHPVRRWAKVMRLRVAYRWADVVVGVSVGVSRDVEAVLELVSGSVVTIRNGIDRARVEAGVAGVPDPGPFAGVFECLARPVVVTVGRLAEQKAQLDLVEAFAALPEGSRGTLVVLGEGPLRGALEGRVRELGLEGRVVLPGFVGNPWWFVARSDVFVLSSRHEGYPLVLLEALACGVRVVSTDCPSGPREMLEGVEGAWLVPVGDVDALTAAITEASHRAAKDGSQVARRDGAVPSHQETADAYERLLRPLIH
jgi:glycosyltransferase involved in cell wall biosynthesis